MENVQVTVEDMVVVDLSSTLHILASFIRRFTLPNALTIKRQFCQLCEKMYSRTASLSFRKDEDVRHHILDIIMEWMQEPANLQDVSTLIL
jgi:neurofibromin 1